MQTISITGVFILLPVLLQGCATAVATGAATGAAVVHDRRTTGTVIEDQAIELKALNAFRGHQELWAQSHVNVTSYNGIVLLSGEAPIQALREEAERRVRAVPKVREIHNEISVAAPSSLLTRSSDSLITSKIKTLMIADENLDPTRVKVVTENGTVYLMGLVDHREAGLATEIARRTTGVQKVVKLFEYFD